MADAGQPSEALNPAAARPLIFESPMPERGVIFSDGFEQDFLEFNSGARAEIAPAERRGRLVV